MVQHGFAKVAPQPDDSPAGVVEAAPPPSSALLEVGPDHLRGKYTEEESLFKAAEAGGTKLVSAKWLVEFNLTRRRDEPIKRQQDLPMRAFINPADLRAKGITSKDHLCRKYLILALSYCWLTPQHPDPKGQQVQTLALALTEMLAYFHECVDIAVFLDFCSLPQEPRDTPEEAAAFHMGLKDVNLWYAHTVTWVFLLTSFPEGWPEVAPYAERGWPSFERRISSLVKDSEMCLDLGCLQGDEYRFYDLKWRCKQGRCAPLGPDAFAADVGRLHFTNGSDIAFVQGKYRQTAVEVFADVEELDFGYLGWARRDAVDLAQALPLATQLKTLWLYHNKIDDEGATAIAGALQRCPALKHLDLSGNEIGDTGAIALAGALPGCPALQELDLSQNPVGTSGCEALHRAAEGRQLKVHVSRKKGRCCAVQ